jgi:formyltetrahydrofolate synthetase
LSRGTHVLEVGVGTGLSLKTYPDVARITAIDISEPMLERARRRAGPNVTIERMDAQAMTFADNSFDHVIAPYVISVVPDPDRVMREIRRVCRPGGTIVVVNHFVHDTDAEVQAIMDYVATQGAEAVLCKHWAHGSEGVKDLAHKVVEVIDGGGAQFAPLYPDEMGLFEKIETVAKRIYRADEVLADKKVRDQLKQWEDDGFGHLPVCMAKTQYSFTTDPTRRGAPNGHSMPVREVRLSAGAGFVVAICGEIMTMPGLPRVPAAESICLNDAGEIEGLF